jgi:two-component sensor histidine kinase
VQVSLDITERKQGEDHRRLLVKELSHRVKNTLAVVQSIATQTLRGAPDLAQASSTLSARLISLAEAHDILAREDWSGADLDQVAAATLKPHADLARFAIEGEQVRLRPKLALALSMAFHELATNAIKYGALSVSTGTVSVSWTVEKVDEKQLLRIEWCERGGPPVVPTEIRGFGTRMLKRVFSAEPGGKVAMSFDTAGLICVLEVDLDPHGGDESAPPQVVSK